MTRHDSRRREDWQRITLRLPPDLYRHLVESAEEGRQSLNSRIVDLLLRNERPTTETVKIGESIFSAWTKAFREVERKLGVELAREAERQFRKLGPVESPKSFPKTKGKSV